MKKIFLALVCFASVAFFASCGGIETDKNPTVSINADKIILTSGEVATFTVIADANVTSKKELSTLKLSVVYNNEEVYTSGAEEISGISYTKEYQLELTLPQEVTESCVFEVTATVTDAAGLNAAKTINVTVEPVEDEELEETPFTWNRHGGSAATGLDEFGLQWTSNGAKLNYAIIKPLEGAKLYKFETSVYANATTLSQKVAAFEGVAEIEQWKEFVVDGAAHQELDVVLGTKYNDEYHLIHITNGEVSQYKGYDFTLTGMAK